MCRLFGYSKQAYYKSLSKQTLEPLWEQQVQKMVLQIRAALPRLGTRKLYHLLQKDMHQDGIKMGRDKLFNLLGRKGLLVYKKKKYTKTTNSKHWLKKYPNLASGLLLHKPEQLWVADITYLQTKTGHEYLHLITDAYSKKIMGYELSENLKAESTLRALDMAVKNRKYKHQLIHHSDRGLQYCSSLYTNKLKENGIKISMTEQYDPYENAVAERVNGILKDEFGLDEIFETNKALHKQLKQAIALYNNLRPHLSIKMLTPEMAHRQTTIKPKTWKKKTPEKTISRVQNES